MQVASTRFGAFEVRDDSAISFPEGLIGLAGTEYALVVREEQAPFLWLHSLEDGSLALPVANPWLFVPDYEVRVSDEDSHALGLDAPEGADILCVVRVAAQPEDCSINLAGPLVIHRGDRVGRQVINDAGGYSVRHPLFTEVELEDARVAAKAAPAVATAV